MSVEERQRLLMDSIPLDPGRVDSPRYAFRVGGAGMEWFMARAHLQQGDEVEYHGYPVTQVPATVLRQFRDRGSLSDAEYRRLCRLLG
jgi:hypothetical protein